MKNLFFLTLLLAIIVLTGCPEDPVGPKPDPCEGKKPVSANFDILESNYWGQDKYYSQTDTILYANIGNFVAKEENATYSWKIGSDSREFTTSKVNLRFYELGSIPVRLIVNKKPDTLCFPDDDGIDTITKMLFVKKFTESDMIGSYWGVNLDAPQDSFLVSIGWYHSEIADADLYFINNLPNGCNDTMNIDDEPVNEDLISINVKPMNKMLIFESVKNRKTNCLGPTGFAKLSSDLETIEINYSVIIDWNTNDRINKKFIGRRMK